MIKLFEQFIKIISTSSKFPNRTNKIQKVETEIRVMKEINSICFQIINHLEAKDITVTIKDDSGNAEEIILFNPWIDDSELNTFVYIDNLELLSYLRMLQEGTELIIGYKFLTDVKIRHTNKSFLMQMGIQPDHEKLPFNFIGSIVVASRELKKQWYHVNWDLSNTKLKKLGWIDPLKDIKRLK